MLAWGPGVVLRRRAQVALELGEVRVVCACHLREIASDRQPLLRAESAKIPKAFEPGCQLISGAVRSVERHQLGSRADPEHGQSTNAVQCPPA